MRKKKPRNRSRLISAAMGKLACDLTIRNVQFFNVFTGEIYAAEVDILDGFVVRVREDGQEAPLPAASVYDGHGCYLIPGFIDTHMHVESTMMIPENLSRAILPWGTTTVCTDPHEIGNVMGIDGVSFMLDNAKLSSLRQYVLAPSCVPSVPGKESTGAVFTAKEVADMLDMDDIVGIAEIMDYVGVIQDSERMHTIIDEGEKRGAFLQGHAPFVTGKDLAAYRLGGPYSDHESGTAEEVSEKLRMGIHVNLRASSLTDDLNNLVDGCRDHLWRDFVSICTDDVHAKDLLTVGHINKVVRKAVNSGLDGREVIKMATLNAAREYQFDDLGAIAPGYIADIQLVQTLDGCRPDAVFVEGKLVAENGVYLGDDKPVGNFTFPNTVNIPQITSPEDFCLRVPDGYQEETIMVNVMSPLASKSSKILRKPVPTRLPVKNGCVDISGDPELVYFCSVNRYGSGSATIAVYRDFGLERGAMATTIAHDSHNLTIAYRDPQDAFLAADALRQCGGGVCAVDEGKLTLLPLPVGGLMSPEPCEVIADQIDAVQSAVNEISGGRLSLLGVAVMSLPVLPSCVITDMGLVDGVTQQFVPVFPD
ncbi:MAG: amidohydrolase family protein [Clostridiales bacterium]|nr:amidohydrolase family protein [Clostridiales bacterium]